MAGNLVTSYIKTVTPNLACKLQGIDSLFMAISKGLQLLHKNKVGEDSCAAFNPSAWEAWKTSVGNYIKTQVTLYKKKYTFK